MPKLTKPKKSNLINDQNFAKANTFEIDFLTSRAKKVFIHLQIAFIKISILDHFDLQRYIHIKTDIFRYIISRVLSQMISNYLDQLFSDYVTYKNLDSNSSKSKIS